MRIEGRSKHEHSKLGFGNACRGCIFYSSKLRKIFLTEEAPVSNIRLEICDLKFSARDFGIHIGPLHEV